MTSANGQANGDATGELYKKHRPKTLDDVVGQPDAVKTLSKLLANPKKFPHTLMLCGPSGVGKTTVARILKNELGCSNSDWQTLNCANDRGIDTARTIISRMGLAPVDGKCRIWMLDEVHKLTGDAQNGLLVPLEDTPRHVYFILCTTEPNKVIPTVRTRSTQVHLSSLSPKILTGLMTKVAKREKINVSAEVLERIAENSEGSARKALVLLNSVIDLETEEEQLEAIAKSDVKKQAIEIARVLVRPGVKWDQVRAVLAEVDLDGEGPEGLRRMILGYASSILLKGGKLSPRAALILECFEGNFYDSGKAGLLLACWNTVNG